MRRYLIYLPLLIVVVALLATVWLPFVNQSTLWLGIPSVMLWEVVCVLLLAPCLGLIEYVRHRDEADDREEQS